MARIVLAKVGTDAHDNGITVVAHWLEEAGHEVVYAGLYNTPESLAHIAGEEDADAVGVSYLGGEPVYLSQRILDVMRDSGLDIPLVVGGVITPEMAAELNDLGVAHIFTAGSSRETIVDGLARAMDGRGHNLPRTG
jgi:methylmalonyl-CoA mutase C-terminal domain/subunit